MNLQIAIPAGPDFVSYEEFQQSSITTLDAMASEIERIGEMCASSIKATA